MGCSVNGERASAPWGSNGGSLQTRRMTTPGSVLDSYQLDWARISLREVGCSVG